MSEKTQFCIIDFQTLVKTIQFSAFFLASYQLKGITSYHGNLPYMCHFCLLQHMVLFSIVVLQYKLDVIISLLGL